MKQIPTTIRFTAKQNWRLWFTANRLDMTLAREMFNRSLLGGVSVNLKTLSDEQLSQLVDLLAHLSTNMSGPRAKLTKRSLRKRLAEVTAFRDQSVVDRLGALGRTRGWR